MAKEFSVMGFFQSWLLYIPYDITPGPGFITVDPHWLNLNLNHNMNS